MVWFARPDKGLHQLHGPGEGSVDVCGALDEQQLALEAQVKGLGGGLFGLLGGETRRAPPWWWDVTDQTEPSMPEWMKDDEQWQATLDAET